MAQHVSAIMTPAPVAIRPGQPVTEAARIMRDHGIPTPDRKLAVTCELLDHHGPIIHTKIRAPAALPHAPSGLLPSPPPTACSVSRRAATAPACRG